MKNVKAIVQSDFWKDRCIVITKHGDEFYRSKKYLKQIFTKTEFEKLCQNDNT